MSVIEFEFEAIDDEFQTAGAGSSLRLDQVVPELLKKVIGVNNPDLDDYRVLVARQVLNNSATLEDLHLNSGDFLLIIRPSTVKVRLVLVDDMRNRRWVVEKQEALIGRRDDVDGIFPEVDLTSALRNAVRISRRQAVLREQGGQWEISLHPDAKSLVFVDNTRLEYGRPVALSEQMTLSFGNSVESPELKVRVQLLGR